jgi:hypothetical protein
VARPTGIGKPYYRQIGQEFHLGYLESSQLEAKILQLATWNLGDLVATSETRRKRPRRGNLKGCSAVSAIKTARGFRVGRISGSS